MPKKHTEANAYNHFLFDDVESDAILKHSIEAEGEK